MFRTLVLVWVAVAGILAVACSSSGAGGREVAVTQDDDGCTPTSISGAPGEKLNLKITNNTSKDYEIEGIDGTNLEEVIIPGDRTREVGYTLPTDGSTGKIKCYVPGDVSTIIEVVPTNAASGTATSAAGGGASASASVGSGSAKIRVGLNEFEVTPSAASVEAGTVEFDATNNSATMFHELAVLRIKDDGSFENMGEVDDIGPGAGGSVVIDLPAGKYQLACLIVPGEAGSTFDHYKQGMHTDFTVK